VVSGLLTAIGAVSDRGVIGNEAIGDGLLAIGDETLSDDEAMRLSGNTIRDESGIASASKSRAWDRVGKRKV
jgi:hypothetical protein